MKYKLYYLIVFSALLIVSFQNCSNKLSFGISNLIFSSETKGNYYTNNNFMDVQLSSENMDLFSEIRYSVNQKLDQQEWKKFSELDVKNTSNQDIEFRAFLGDQYKSDGTLDGEKVIYVGLRGYDRLDKNKIYQADFEFKMFLDTQAPKIVPNGILQEGIKGKIYKLDQDVELNLSMIDPQLEQGKASSFGIESLRWAITKNGDCSEEFLTNKSSWMPKKESLSVAWPENDPMNAFYFCIFAKDQAGNVTNFMSPAMTSLWSTIAGDNSVGNGSGVNSPNVRFKLPQALFLDPQGNLHFYDDGFGVRRMIMNSDIDPSRTIQVSNYPIKNAGIVVYDSNGNSYSQNGSFFVFLEKDQTVAKNIIQVTNASNISYTIRKFNGIESLLIAVMMNYVANDVAANSYLFEIPIGDIQNLTSTNVVLKNADLIQKYVLIGNGIAPNTTCSGKPAPCSTIDYTIAENNNLVLSSSDYLDVAKKIDPKYSLGLIRGLTTDDQGSIYITTSADGSNANVGQHTLRQLKYLSPGKFQQRILTTNIPWLSGVNYFKKIKSATEIQELVYVTSVSSPTRVIDLSANPVTVNTIFQVNGLFVNDYNRGILVPNRSKTDFEYYIAASSSSHIYRFSSNGELLETFGRDTSSNLSTDPLNSVIGHPDGLVIDRANDRMWITDSQYNMIYSLQNNELKKVSLGQPTTNDKYTIGYRTKIAYNSINDELYWTQFDGKILKVKASDYTQSVLFASFTGTNQLPIYNWRTSGIFFDQINNTLLVNRIYPSNSASSLYDSFVAFTEKANLNNISNYDAHQILVGNILKGSSKLSQNSLTQIMLPTDIAMTSADLNFQLDKDTTGNIYLSNDQFKITDGANQLRVLNMKMSGAFKVISGEGSLENFRYVIGGPVNGNLRVVKINVKDIYNLSVNRNPIIYDKYLCLAGTKLRYLGTFDVDSKGQLVFVDSGNARVLKYLIRNNDGELAIDQLAQTTCP